MVYIHWRTATNNLCKRFNPLPFGWCPNLHGSCFPKLNLLLLQAREKFELEYQTQLVLWEVRRVVPNFNTLPYQRDYVGFTPLARWQCGHLEHWESVAKKCTKCSRRLHKTECHREIFDWKRPPPHKNSSILANIGFPSFFLHCSEGAGGLPSVQKSPA